MRLQIVTHGHPVTTGIRSLDYFVSYESFEASCFAQRHFSERLVTLPGRIAYPVQYTAPDAFTSGNVNEDKGQDSASANQWQVVTAPQLQLYLAQNAPGFTAAISSAVEKSDWPDSGNLEKSHRFRLYFCAQFPDKLVPGAMDRILSQILTRDPQAVVLILAPMLDDETPDFLDEHLRIDPFGNPTPTSVALVSMLLDRIRSSVAESRFATSGPGGSAKERNESRRDADRIDGSMHNMDPSVWSVQQRLIAVRRLHPKYYFALLREATILDTFPYGGYTTAMDAFAVGSPVVTLRHPELGRGRATASLLQAMEVPELITASVEEYVQVAIRLARASQQGVTHAWYGRLVRQIRQGYRTVLRDGSTAGGAWHRLLVELARGKKPTDLYEEDSNDCLDHDRSTMDLVSGELQQCEQ